MKTTITIPFSPSGGETGLTLELDADKNAGVTSFAPGANVWVRAITDYAIADKGSTRGKFTVQKSRLRFEQEETLTFNDENAATLRYPAHKVLKKGWLGRGLGHVTVSGKTVKAAETGYGILEVRYEVAYARLKLANVNKEGPVLIWAEDAQERKGVLQVSFSSGEAGEMEEIFVEVLSYCTDLPAAGVAVWLDGAYKGQTDAYGRLSLGKLVKGSNHAIKMTAAGFKDSDIDALANDVFTVQ